MSQQKCAPVPITFSGVASYDLTASYVASDAAKIDFANMLTIYCVYTPDGSATGTLSLQYYVEVNPYSASEDTAGTYWSQVGIFTDSSGTWTEEKASYVSAAGSAGVAQTLVPLVLEESGAKQVRIYAKDLASTAQGTAEFIIVKNNQ